MNHRDYDQAAIDAACPDHRYVAMIAHGIRNNAEPFVLSPVNGQHARAVVQTIYGDNYYGEVRTSGNLVLVDRDGCTHICSQSIVQAIGLTAAA
jgi:hypothetical protein